MEFSLWFGRFYDRKRLFTLKIHNIELAEKGLFSIWRTILLPMPIDIYVHMHNGKYVHMRICKNEHFLKGKIRANSEKSVDYFFLILTAFCP